MRVVWVPQLAVLPVIVEDRAMLDEQGRREYAPTVGQSPENAAQLRPGESDGRTAPGEFSKFSTLGLDTADLSCLTLPFG